MITTMLHMAFMNRMSDGAASTASDMVAGGGLNGDGSPIIEPHSSSVFRCYSLTDYLETSTSLIQAPKNASTGL
jgi:hypothetical protein